jgi:FKBP12-rapamycin complex-associated protein
VSAYLREPTDDGERRLKRDVLVPLIATLKTIEPCDSDRRHNPTLFNNFREFIEKLNTREYTNIRTLLEKCSGFQCNFGKLRAQKHRVRFRDIVPELANWNGPAFPMFGSRDIQIFKFEDEVKILPSKQRPRLIRVRGSDGHSYSFLLKAHEDLRNDQRVMQLFDLLNGFLKSRITTFAIVPLTSTVGLIQWVPKTVSLYKLISNQLRAVTHSDQDVNLGYIDFFGYFGAQDIHSIHGFGIHRLEAFNIVIKRYASQETALRDAMWNFAPDSEAWLAYQANYTTSLAVMSMIGYLIGLGDRHSENVMLDRIRGRTIQIDFGDLYDAARNRPNFPEFVPFRLTRMIVAAMGPSGYDGMFRKCCEETLMTVRHNQEAILRILKINERSPTRPGGRFSHTNRADSERDRSLTSAKSDYRVVEAKVTGMVFKRDGKPATIADQVDKLLRQAVDPYNLCRGYPGWSPWW